MIDYEKLTDEALEALTFDGLPDRVREELAEVYANPEYNWDNVLTTDDRRACIEDCVAKCAAELNEYAEWIKRTTAELEAEMKEVMAQGGE